MSLMAFGFGSFPGVADNPSRFAAFAASQQAEILDVSYAAVDLRIAQFGGEALDVIAFGIAAKSTRPRIEICARNRDSSSVPDVDGFIRDGPIESDAPESIPGHWLEPLLVALAPFDIETSDDAGGYLCNHLYWRLLRRPQGAAVFIHLPPGREPEWYAELGAACAEAIRCWDRRTPCGVSFPG